MSKKEPKIVQVGEEKVEVSDEVYEFMRKNDFKMDYRMRIRKTERTVVKRETVTFIPSAEDSFDRLSDLGTEFATDEKSIEDILITREDVEKLRAALEKLTDDERRLIGELFFTQDCEGLFESEIGEILGITQQAVSKRRAKILNKLKNFIEN
jgi:RNA polymerase sigma factor, sigma-70 family